MAIPNKQIGWSGRANLLWAISKQLDILNTQMCTGPCPTTTSTTTLPPTTTTTSSSTSTTTSTTTILITTTTTTTLAPTTTTTTTATPTTTTTTTAADVTPNPTPNWANVIDPTSSAKTVAVQQIQGITSTINLEVSRSGDVFKIYYKIDNSAPAWTNGGSLPGDFTSWTEITSFPVIINVSNNQYVSFGCAPSLFGQNATSTITVKNNSDSAITLDTFTATVSNEE